MSVFTADPMGLRPGKTKTIGHRRPDRPEMGTIAQDVKMLADRLWEDAMGLAKGIGGEHPADAEAIEPKAQWEMLELVAIDLPPVAWTDPNALEDLFKLRKQFLGLEHQNLKIWAATQRKLKNMRPDPAITPANPEFDAMRRRLARSGEPVKATKAPQDEAVARYQANGHALFPGGS